MRRIEQHGSKQDGLSLVGLIFVVAILACIVVLGMKIVPTYVEYRAIVNAINTAKANAATAREVQSSFDKSAQATYIDAITGKDLIISNETGQLEVSFAYEKKIPLVGPASLVLDYEASTAKGGPPAPKPAE